MSKFTFICDNSYDLLGGDSRLNVTTKEFEGETLTDVLEEFESFLRGCGYFFNGQLDVVENEYDEGIDIDDAPDEPYVLDLSKLNINDAYGSMADNHSSIFDDTITITGSSKN